MSDDLSPAAKRSLVAFYLWRSPRRIHPGVLNALLNGGYVTPWSPNTAPRITAKGAELARRILERRMGLANLGLAHEELNL